MTAILIEDGRILFETISEDGFITLNEVILEDGRLSSRFLGCLLLKLLQEKGLNIKLLQERKAMNLKLLQREKGLNVKLSQEMGGN